MSIKRTLKIINKKLTSNLWKKQRNIKKQQCLQYLDLFPAEKFRDLFGKFPEFGEVDVTTVDAVGTTFVDEVHVFHEQTEEGDDNLKETRKRT